jgi:hypothetical protein
MIRTGWAAAMWHEDELWADENGLRDGVLALVAVAETEDDFGMVGAGRGGRRSALTSTARLGRPVAVHYCRSALARSSLIGQ